RQEQYALTGVTWMAGKGGQPPYQIEVKKPAGTGKEETIGVLFVGSESANSLAASLRRLLEGAWPGPPDRLLPVAHERQPLKLGATGASYRAQLIGRASPRFTELTLSFLQYAELHALQTVVGDARSGGLEVQAGPGQERTVSEAEVLTSLHRRGRYLAQL